MKVAFSIILLSLSCQLLAKNDLHAPLSDTITKPDTISQIKRDLQENLPTISISDDDLDEGSTAAVSSILTAGRDPFLSSAEYNFSPVRFRLRGYENSGDAIYLNGVDFTALDNGFTPFGLWSGLTNVMRSRETAYGLEANNFAIGSLALNTNIDLRAGAQWAQTQIGYALSNRNYRHRLTFTHGSGFNHKGWAYSLAMATRYADEGYVPGTYYRSLSYYAAVDKKWGDKNIISLIAFGAPTENGRQSASTQEAMDLAGTHFYNPSWGYQNGKKRNSNVAETYQPAFMLVHEYKPTTNSSWLTTLAYTFGKRKISSFDWYNAPDPRPDYYRYLPSYYETTEPAKMEALTNLFRSNPNLLQVNWNDLYEVNRNNYTTIYNVNGEAGNNASGNRSLYILSNRVNDLQRFIGNTVYNTRLGKSIALTLGANYQKQVNQYYQEVKDLLGGDFWVNVNQFAERDNPNDPNALQYDVDKPNQLKRNGDQYGYNYKMTMNRAAAWAQSVFTYNHVDLFAAGEISYSNFYRTGLNRNGLFPNSSFGDSKKSDFVNVTAKAGITYKLNGRNYFFINGAYLTNPPFFENVFISQRTRNDLQSDIKSEQVVSAEGGYRINAPRIKAVLTGYYTKISNVYDVINFYSDVQQNFGSLSISDMQKLHFGGEFGLEAKLTSTLTFNAAASVGRYYYGNRPHAVFTVDNTAAVTDLGTLYIKNYRVSTPQEAYSAGFFYRSPKYWYISITGNYFRNMWINIFPLKRSLAYLPDVDITQPENQQYLNIWNQEKFKDAFTLDFFGGWSKRLPKQYNINNKSSYLVFNLGVNNILNNKNIRSGGYEQSRFDIENMNKFDSKYYYAYGLNYYASIAFRFN